MDMLNNFLFIFFMLIGGLVFSILSYHHRKNNALFVLGIVFTFLALIPVMFNFAFYVSGNMFAIFVLLILGTSTFFLIMGKTTTAPNESDVTDAFLDDVINSEDEEWDPES